MTHRQQTLVAVMGPTAAGKTALALALANQFPIELISVDSAQVYRGLDIGTAKPDAATLRRFPHRLIDIREPWEPYSAAAFRADALAAIAEIRRAGRTPLLVGGTMLYFRALLDGLSTLPEADPAVRARIEAAAGAHGWEAMHARLAAADPTAAARIHPNDPQRITRALEVIELSGRSMTEQLGTAVSPPALAVSKLVVAPRDRAKLHRQIAKRCTQMFDAGLIGEVQRLMADPRIHADLPAMRSVGYRQVLAHLAGEYDEAEARRRVLYATRQLAKRQLTWLRREVDALWLDPAQPAFVNDAAQHLARFLRA